MLREQPRRRSSRRCRRTGAGSGRGAARLRDGLPLWVVGVARRRWCCWRCYLGLRLSLNNALRPRLRDAPGPRRQAAGDRRAAAAAAAGRGAAARDLPEARDRRRAWCRCATWPTASIVVIRATASSSPAAPVIADRTLPLLARIAEALTTTPGKVLITGHTDNQPIRSLRFPSNWHLSQDARRRGARRCSAHGVKPARMRAEGRADAEPVDAERHARQPRAQPARRDHAHRSVERSMNTAERESGVSVASGMKQVLRLPASPAAAGAARRCIASAAADLVRRPADRDRRVRGRSIRPGSRARSSSPSCSVLLASLRAVWRACAASGAPTPRLVQALAKGPSSADNARPQTLERSASARRSPC